jgi:RimJ/RimL family protein N-acetyltransferase
MIRITEGFPEWAWPLAWEWANARRSQLADDFFPSSIGEFVESYSVRFGGSRTYSLWKNDNLGGVIVLERASPVVFTAHILLSRRLWGVPASDLRQAAALLFEAEPQAIRIQAFVPAWNRLAIALAKRIGAKDEGTLRCATLRNGAPADAVLMGFTREDLNGTELRRSGGRDRQQREQQQLDEQYILGAAVGPADPIGIEPFIEPDSVRRGNDEPGRHGAKNGRGGHDKQDVGRTDGSGKHVPRSPRVRKVGGDGIDGASGGARKGKRPRGK